MTANDPSIEFHWLGQDPKPIPTDGLESAPQKTCIKHVEVVPPNIKALLSKVRGVP